MQVTIGTMNVQNTPDMSRKQVRLCGVRARETGVDILGLQEISERGEDLHDVMEGLGPAYAVAQSDQSTPIAFRRSMFKLTDETWVPFHPGDADIPTPKRGMSVAGLKRPLRLRAPRLIVRNAHAINGAFNNNHPRTQRQRRVLWGLSYDRADDHHTQCMSSPGCQFVIDLGDWNKAHMEPFHPRMEWIHGAASIDKVAITPKPGWGFRVIQKRRVSIPSDHDLLVATVALFRK